MKRYNLKTMLMTDMYAIYETEAVASLYFNPEMIQL